PHRRKSHLARDAGGLDARDRARVCDGARRRSPRRQAHRLRRGRLGARRGARARARRRGARRAGLRRAHGRRAARSGGSAMGGGKTAIARANIALIKDWANAPGNENLTAVPSLSLTLAALSTRTHVRFDPALDADRVQLGGALAEGRPRARVVSLLDALRARAGRTERAEVVSENDFPTASGLASSASGFAALALAASAALGLELSPAELSSQARAASASAARSVFGGYVELLA